MPEFYRNAWYAQLKRKVDELQEEIEKAIELPSVTSADEGKVLTVDVNGKWAAEEVPDELPVVQTTDAGKVLTVDENGAWSAETLNCGNHFSTDEQVIGTWIDGKKLYQKTISQSNITSRTEFSVITSTTMPNIKIVDFNGYFIDPWGSFYDLKAYYDSANYRTYGYLRNNQTELRAYGSFGSEVYNNISLIVTIKYTKTE